MRRIVYRIVPVRVPRTHLNACWLGLSWHATGSISHCASISKTVGSGSDSSNTKDYLLFADSFLRSLSFTHFLYAALSIPFWIIWQRLCFSVWTTSRNNTLLLLWRVTLGNWASMNSPSFIFFIPRMDVVPGIISCIGVAKITWNNKNFIKNYILLHTEYFKWWVGHRFQIFTVFGCLVSFVFRVDADLLLGSLHILRLYCLIFFI